ncbi:MAG TPA: anti-sigma factor, partial [Quisquiliibacterium sp.]|nr:anti-sigma factor [Quisquiliibacterium sp.]
SGPAAATLAPEIRGLDRAAAVAHAAYAPEVRHPVEVGASEQTHLVAWLSKRLGAPLKVPDLGGEGFRLIGGRLLPDDTGVAAQFMFEAVGGQRLTLYVRRDADGADTAFRFSEEHGLLTFYWLDRGFGYALSGELARDTMQAVATSVYRQLNP